jgi:hypothetical protein
LYEISDGRCFDAFRETHLRKSSEREQLAELMKRILVGAFYALQGLVNLVMALFLGSRVVGLEMMIKAFLGVASCLSLLTALTLFSPQAHKLGREDSPLFFGLVTSVLFGLFYVWMTLIGYSHVVEQYSSRDAIVLLLSLIIVVLNAVSVSLLTISYRNK